MSGRCFYDKFLVRRVLSIHIEFVGQPEIRQRQRCPEVFLYRQGCAADHQCSWRKVAHTGDEYGLLLNKKFVNKQFWSDSSATLKRRDNWDDNAGFVVADRTTANDNIIKFQGDLATVPENGSVLEQYQDGSSVFVRAIFPIRDAAGNTVGAMFVVRDITAVYTTMRRTQNILLVLTFVSLSGGILIMLTLLNRFIFKRLKHILTAATRLVGGDFETEIKTDSEDEVGQLEKLFEQFRHIFVSVLVEMSGTQAQK